MPQSLPWHVYTRYYISLYLLLQGTILRISLIQHNRGSDGWRTMAKRNANKYLSIRIARILMKTIGFWPAETKKGKLLLNGTLTYTLFAFALALWIESTELYLGTGDFYVSKKTFDIYKHRFFSLRRINLIT